MRKAEKLQKLANTLNSEHALLDIWHNALCNIWQFYSLLVLKFDLYTHAGIQKPQ